MNARDEYLEYMNEAELFRESSITTKAEILGDIDNKIAIIGDDNKRDPNHSTIFYRKLRDLLLELRNKVEKTSLFSKLEDMWEYVIDIYEDKVELRLQHSKYVDFDEEGFVRSAAIDSDFCLIQVIPQMLTVEEYSKLYGVTDGTVRQWIRRGKLRSAKKVGGEWLISELAELSGRGYARASYRWNRIISDLPEEYQYMNDYQYVHIEQDKVKKDVFHVQFEADSDENEEGIVKIIDMATKEKEKFELMLISNPFIEKPSSYISILNANAGKTIERAD